LKVTANLEQITKLVQNGTQVDYEIHNRIVNTENIPMELLVCSTETQEYSHPATILDLNIYPASRGEARSRNLLFYRVVEMQKTYTLQLEAQSAQEVIKSRINRLVAAIANALNLPYPKEETFELSADKAPKIVLPTPPGHAWGHHHDDGGALAPHALGGSAHLADTLRHLNEKLVGELLDAAGTPRPPTAIEIHLSPPFYSTYDSTTSIPEGARILATTLQITTPFNSNATLEVQVLEPVPVTLMLAAENNPALADTYRIEDEVTTTANGKIRVVVGNAPTVGAGILTVEYVQTFLP